MVSVDDEEETTRLIHVVKRPQLVFRCWRKECALARCTHELNTGKRRPVFERPLECTSSNSALHYLWASHGWSLKTLETCCTCLLSLSCRCASVRFAPHRGGV